MDKSEYALETVSQRLKHADGPVKVNDLIIEARAYRYSDDGDPRWLGFAIYKLDAAGTIRYNNCDAEHNHDSDTCTVQWVDA